VNASDGILNLAFGGFVWLLVFVPPFVLVMVAVFHAITLPLRRQERIRFLLDLVESGFRQGRGVEQALAGLSRSADPALGGRFHLVAAHLEQGVGMSRALERVPSLVPPQVVGMLRVGEEIGEPGVVLPACRRLIGDGSARMRSGFHYLVVLIFVLAPVVPLLVWWTEIFILPQLREVFAEMLEVGSVPVLSDWAFEGASLLAKGQALVVLGAYGAAVAYLGGPWLGRSIQSGLEIRPLDWFILRIPWRRKRLLRDFAAMLAALLDVGVPEGRAVEQAAESTANRAFHKQAEKVLVRLRGGEALRVALNELEPGSELEWRFGNAAQSRNGFTAALRGWLEALDARAFQEEQSASQFLTGGLVLLQGLMIGLLAFGFFHLLVSLIEEAAK
jgi:type II secretory pathway component PulF